MHSELFEKSERVLATWCIHMSLISRARPNVQTIPKLWLLRPRGFGASWMTEVGLKLGCLLTTNSSFHGLVLFKLVFSSNGCGLGSFSCWPNGWAAAPDPGSHIGSHHGSLFHGVWMVASDQLPSYGFITGCLAGSWLRRGSLALSRASWVGRRRILDFAGIVVVCGVSHRV